MTVEGPRLNLPLLQLVEARPALARTLVARHAEKDEQHRRYQEAPGRPEGMVAPAMIAEAMETMPQMAMTIGMGPTRCEAPESSGAHYG